MRASKGRARALVLLLVVGIVAAGCGSSSKSSSSSSSSDSTKSPTTSAGKTSRGFDGSTITVAGLGIKSQLPSVEFGARGRIARFNATNELPGVKINFAEFADDKQDPATALAEARRLVAEEKVFAIVGDSSASNPGEYLAQNHVPVFGSAYDNTYCSPTPVTTIWAFGYNGCAVNADPKELPDQYRELAQVVKEKTGKAHPTMATFSSDSASGRSSVKFGALAMEGRDFKVVYAKASVPPPPVSDYTPYIQQLLTSDGGHAPDAMVCLLAVDCIPMYKGLVAAGFKGFYYSSLYSDSLVESMKGSYVNVGFQPFDQPSDGYTQLKKDVTSVKADQVIDIGAVVGYLSADMFISAVKLAAKDGGISPENVQAKAAHQTWEIKGFAGPTIYPSATAHTHGCAALTYDDGTSFKTVVPFSCSDTTFPVK